MRVRLTKRYLETLKPSKDTDIWDENFPRGSSFGVRVTRNGSKSFVFRYRTPDGRRPKVNLGRFPLVSLADARNQAKDLAARVSKGEDPAGERRQRLQAPTFAELAEDFLNSPRLARRSERTRYEYGRMLRYDLLPAFGRMKAADVRKRHIVSLLDKVLMRGSEVMACRVRALVSVIFNFALEREIVEVNPVSGVRKPAPERTRDRYLNEDEIRTLWQALETEKLVIQGLYRFLLTTAQRIGETCMAEWTHIQGDTWSIPAENTKPGRAHTVPLSPQALAILEPLRDLGSPYVFPSPSSRGKGRPVAWFSKATARLQAKCGFEFRPHDLRRTAATMLAELGTAEETLRKLLNHKSGSTGVTAIYDRADRRTDVRRALLAWGTKLEKILGQGSSAAMDGDRSDRGHSFEEKSENTIQSSG